MRKDNYRYYYETKSKKRTRTNQEIEDLFKQRINLLRTNTVLFDDGDDSVALQMAVHLRVLLYNSRTSHALLDSIGRFETMKFWDSTRMAYSKENMLSTWGLMEQKCTSQGNQYVPNGDKEIFYQYPDENSSGEMKPEFFMSRDDWWNYIVLASDGRTLTRGDIITYLANKDGAHVDLNGTDIDDFKSSSILGWFDQNDQAPGGNPLYVAIRQIVTEFLVSLEVFDTQYSQVFPSRKGKIQSRKIDIKEDDLYFIWYSKPDGESLISDKVDKSLVNGTKTWKWKVYNEPNWSFMSDNVQSIQIIEFG